jgi:hypothetical protein
VISLYIFFIISPLSFHAENNPDQWYQSRLLLIVFFFQCMSPMRSEYRKLGIEIVSLEVQSLSHTQETLHGRRKEN